VIGDFIYGRFAAGAGVVELAVVASKVLEDEFGPALVKLLFQEIVYLARKG